ncbi:uncharacterized protein LOC139917254 [Centroberyx gerrardi]
MGPRFLAHWLLCTGLHSRPLHVRRGSQCISSPPLSKGSAKISISSGAAELGHLFHWLLSSGLRKGLGGVHGRRITMKTIRVLVLLLLASFQFFTTVLSDETDESGQPAVVTTLKPKPKQDPTPGPAPPAPAATTTVTATIAPIAPTAPTREPPEIKKAEPPTTAAVQTTVPPPPAPTEHKDLVTPTLPPSKDNNTAVEMTQQNDTVAPVSTKDESQPKQGSDDSSETSKADVTPEPVDSNKETPKPDKAAPAPAPAPTPASGQKEKDDKKPVEKGGTQIGTEEKAPPKSDKRLLWILLPVLGVAVAAVVCILKFKCMKVHDHTETIDNGTENASFQSRPDSTKDGVMLLGVKSSGGEENAAAR